MVVRKHSGNCVESFYRYKKKFSKYTDKTWVPNRLGDTNQNVFSTCELYQVVSCDLSNCDTLKNLHCFKLNLSIRQATLEELKHFKCSSEFQLTITTQRYHNCQLNPKIHNWQICLSIGFLHSFDSRRNSLNSNPRALIWTRDIVICFAFVVLCTVSSSVLKNTI